VDLARAVQLQKRGIEAWLRVHAGGDGGGRMFEADGVAASIIPACPGRSVLNSVLFRDAGALGSAIDDLAAAYDAAGIHAWTVWVPDYEREAIELLADAGHRFDAEPAAMHLDLGALDVPQHGDLDWDAEADPAEVGRINDLAYGHGPHDGLAPAIAGQEASSAVRLYRARVDGEVACVLEAIDVDGDCVIAWVATLEAHRGKRLAARLLGVALAEAAERGLRTSTLQATRMGYPVYDRLGYRAVCRLQMWERRA
jgi:GNAT superfamily N-acetyltransferase